jgi:LysM repeat protein
MQSYTVKKGDTLSGIAKKFNVSLSAILSANPSIKNPNIIRVGQVITIPVPPVKKATTSVVQAKPPSYTSPNQQAVKKPTSSFEGFSLGDNSAPPGAAGTARVKGMFDNVKFSFNPEEIMDSKGNVWDFTDPSNHRYPIPHHQTGRTPTITFDLYVNDQEEAGACARLINKLNSHIPSESTQYATYKPPAPMIFSFGKNYVKKVLLEDFKVRRTRFNQELQTMEATINVSLIIVTQ